MNCNDFKNKVADLFDKNIDMHTKAQMNEHMANCHECKAYYDELRETFSMLQPKEAANMSKAKTTHRLWHYAAAAAVFLFGNADGNGDPCFCQKLGHVVPVGASAHRSDEGMRSV